MKLNFEGSADDFNVLTGRTNTTDGRRTGHDGSVDGRDGRTLTGVTDGRTDSEIARLQGTIEQLAIAFMGQYQQLHSAQSLNQQRLEQLAAQQNIPLRPDPALLVARYTQALPQGSPEFAPPAPPRATWTHPAQPQVENPRFEQSVPNPKTVDATFSEIPPPLPAPPTTPVTIVPVTQQPQSQTLDRLVQFFRWSLTQWGFIVLYLVLIFAASMSVASKAPISQYWLNRIAEGPKTEKSTPAKSEKKDAKAATKSNK